MGKGNKKMEKAGKIAFAMVLALLMVSLASAAGAAAQVQIGCSVFPSLSLGDEKITVIAGRLAALPITVSGAQASSCGAQQYGVDFTNGYDGKQFVLALSGLQERNLFQLASGKEKTFEGLIGVPPGTEPGNYTVQVTAYLEADHWKQVSKTIRVEVKPAAGSDASWATNLNIGWNLVPYAEGIGVYGCNEIITGYRYSPTSGEYVQMDRFGAQFSPAPFEPNVENERFGGMFVFSTKRCTMESRVPPETLANAKVSLFGGQLLSISPAWNNKEAGAIAQECASQSGTQASQVQLRKWDAAKQEWITPAQSDLLSNGEVWKILPKGECELGLSG
ncbi:MAG: hypothetical protein NTX79_06950 [Candidatus Micrarchaeota archaeon]|nr:hypothetical protein [Candidatus Micrarchaeota archaeon]